MSEQLIHSILNDLNSASFDITASALISTDGLPIAAVLQRGADADRVGGMSAALLALGKRAVRELRCGNFNQVAVQGDDGYILLLQVGEEAVLVMTAKHDAKLGMLLLNARNAVKRLTEMKQLRVL